MGVVGQKYCYFNVCKVICCVEMYCLVFYFWTDMPTSGLEDFANGHQCFVRFQIYID